LTRKKDMSLMNPEKVSMAFGLTVGAIAPIGTTLAEIPTLVDPSVFKEEFVDISTGHPEVGIELKSADLKRFIVNATIHPIAK
jgi:prolyl-tRNA editing enzyme YbaK/EbsC (Cys-tRNA(Pro) deacylase)